MNIFTSYFKVSVEFFSPIYLSTYLQKSVCVLYSTHIFYFYSDLYKVLPTSFTIPEMENERKTSLSFWITVATSYCCALGVGKMERFLLKYFCSRDLDHIQFETNVPLI